MEFRILALESHILLYFCPHVARYLGYFGGIFLERVYDLLFFQYLFLNNLITLRNIQKDEQALLQFHYEQIYHTPTQLS